MTKPWKSLQWILIVVFQQNIQQNMELDHNLYIFNVFVHIIIIRTLHDKETTKEVG